MSMYITLVKWTGQGYPNVKESPARVDAFKQAASALGVDVKAVYLVAAYLEPTAYVFVAITEAHDDEASAKLSLAARSLGNVSTETVRAFTEAESATIS